jgi:hypothetical protein
MEQKNSFAIIVAVLALVVAGVAVFLDFGPSFGGIVHQQKESFVAGLFAGTNRQLDINKTGEVLLGTNGTRLAAIVTGSCTLWAPANTIAATSTQQVECQTGTTGGITRGLTGVTSGSWCTLTQASTTPGATASGGIVVTGSSASSTDGTITGKVLNLTGTTFTWGATASSSIYWKYSCLDPA